MRRFLLILCLLPLAAITAPPARAATDTCFKEVPYCISGRFASYWQGNGGLPVFGLPLTTSERRGEGEERRRNQYFERARFESHSENPRPYDVLLSRLGVDILTAQGRDWQAFPKGDPKAPHYFAETGHAIALQFWGFWSSNGLEFDGNKRAKSLPESLALFGLPISEAQMEAGADGNLYLTQWFERARFEYHPENKKPYDVLLGRLGADALAASQPPPPPQGLPGIPTPAGACARNAPLATEGVQAWTTEPEPKAPGTNNSLCARLIANGAVVSGAQVSAVAHYSDSNFDYGPATTGPDGVAEIGFNISTAKNRFIVTIDVTITAPNGQVYTTQTNFRPNYPLDGQPPVSGTPLPNIPPPTGNCIANAPPPLEGPQAWVTNIQPSAPGQFNSLCARLIVNGAVVSGAQVDAIAYYPGPDKTYGPATTGPDGVAELGFNIGDTPDRYIVFMDVTFTAPDGRTYSSTTYFRPNYLPAP